MSKFHINSAGEVKPCRAVKGNCPFGGSESHYSTESEAQSAADKINAEKFGVVSEDPNVNFAGTGKPFWDVEFELSTGNKNFTVGEGVYTKIEYEVRPDVANEYGLNADDMSQIFRNSGNYEYDEEKGLFIAYDVEM